MNDVEEIAAIRERLARQDEMIVAMRQDAAETRADVKSILAALNQLNGGKRAAIWVFGAIATIITTIGALIMIWQRVK